MNISILGRKLGMTQLFDASNVLIPVTILKVNLHATTQLKTATLENLGPELLKLPSRHVQGEKTSASTVLDTSKHVGSMLSCIPSTILFSSEFYFKVGDIISVRGVSIGKGFAGTVKRHGFSRGPMTHGSKNHRQPGSIGMGTSPGRVYPGKRMAGRLGGKNITVRNLQVVSIFIEQNLIFIKGAVPGKVGTCLSMKILHKN